MEDTLKESDFKFDIDDTIKGFEQDSDPDPDPDLDFMDSNEKKEVESTVISLKGALKSEEKSDSKSIDKSVSMRNKIYIAVVALCVAFMVLMGYGAYGLYQKKIENMEKEKILSLRPQEANSCIGSLAVRVFPTSDGDKAFMEAPVKIIAVKDNMINYIDGDGESKILENEFCDDNWMKWEDYQKLKNLGEDFKEFKK